MKMISRQGVLWVTVAMLALPAVVYAQDLTYTTNDDNTITITGYTGVEGGVTITNVINDLPVTSIGFLAFNGCTSLTNLTIPASITNIGDYTFMGCSNLLAITVDATNASYCSVDGVVFDKSQTTLIQCPGGKAGTYAIPDGVTFVYDGAFRSCIRLANVTMPDSVPYIASWVFADCPSLTNVTISAKVTSIGDSAFWYCTSLTDVTIPGLVTSIGNETFYGCTNLTSIHFQGDAPSDDGSEFQTDSGYDPVTVYYLPATTGWGSTFGGLPTVPLGYGYTDNGDGTCTITGYTGGGGVTIPNTISNLLVTSIGSFAFDWCTSLANVTIGTNVTSIGGWAFQECTSLTSVTIPASVTSIGWGAFSWCTSLSTITVNSSNSFYGSVAGVLFDKSQTTLIEYPAASGSYTIPTSVTNIEAFAFEGCTSLTNVIIGTNVTSIGGWAFTGCGDLRAITVNPSNSVYSSVAGVLFDESQATLIAYPGGIEGSYTIPSGVTNIRGGAFQNCSSLTSVTIPSSVTNIGDWAFASCTGLGVVHFQGNVPLLGGPNLFSSDNATIYYLPETTGWDTFGYTSTVLWNPQVLPDDGNFGVRTNCFGFTFTNAGSPTIVVQACTNLMNPGWFDVGTNTLTGGSSYFSDSQWTNYPIRFYRFCAP